ncbi:androgen-induced gene 1 protein-like [Dermatophagoides pteronyssinus]|uniref:androgen-induced gene 1 protein-like n=1 Tax=Dermatophagoides pteronyssinus TaxID=6956 RepID=UPI003F66CF6F
MTKMTSNKFLLIIRFAAFLLYGYSVFYRQKNETLPPHLRNRPFGKWKFLTYWDLLLQFGFFGLALIGSFRWTPKSFGRLVDFVFYSLAFPVAMFVAISFWSLWSIDRELVFPKAYDPYYPYWLHQTSHTLVALLVLVELIFANRNPPSKQAHGLIMINLFSYVYSFWVLYIALTTDIWVYPVLQKLNWPLRICFGVALGLINSLFYKMAIFCRQNFFKQTPNRNNKKIK